jgi:hypothetical protein
MNTPLPEPHRRQQYSRAEKHVIRWHGQADLSEFPRTAGTGEPEYGVPARFGMESKEHIPGAGPLLRMATGAGGGERGSRGYPPARGADGEVLAGSQSSPVRCEKSVPPRGFFRVCDGNSAVPLGLTRHAHSSPTARHVLQEIRLLCQRRKQSFELPPHFGVVIVNRSVTARSSRRICPPTRHMQHLSTAVAIPRNGRDADPSITRRYLPDFWRPRGGSHEDD